MTASKLASIFHKVQTEPSGEFAAVTKSDVTVFTFPTRGLYIGGAGDVAVVSPIGSAVTFSAVPAGTLLPIAVVQVLSTGTSATLIIAVY